MSTTSYLPQLRIVSGGQSGVDRAALDFAIEHGFEHGGWIPKGRIAEDGPVDGRYKLRETEGRGYADRTRRNASDSDGTVIFCETWPLKGGTRFTKKVALEQYRPVLELCDDKHGAEEGAALLREWIEDERIETLNVAGPRESQAPGLRRFVTQVLRMALSS